jgi:hypothetical protein
VAIAVGLVSSGASVDIGMLVPEVEWLAVAPIVEDGIVLVESESAVVAAIVDVSDGRVTFSVVSTMLT